MSDERMKRLIESFETKNEVYIQEGKEINEEKISKEFSDFKKILGNSYLRESSTVVGQTVTSLAADQNIQIPGAGNNIPTPMNTASLQPQEALMVAVKRALASGAPVNDLDFYSEVNWHLAGLGFGPQSAVIIKEAISGLITE